MFPEPNEHPSIALIRYVDKMFGELLKREVGSSRGSNNSIDGGSSSMIGGGVGEGSVGSSYGNYGVGSTVGGGGSIPMLSPVRSPHQQQLLHQSPVRSPQQQMQPILQQQYHM